MSASALDPGTRLGAYEIVRPLGKGGMGEVYRARDPRLDREVALKLLPPELATDPERLSRFEQEARALAALRHPNIVTIFSVESVEPPYGPGPPVRFLTMELVEGRTLDQLIPPGGLALVPLLELAIPLVGALASAHRRGIVHRDLKPGNVLVGEEGRLQVVDFGLAKRLADREGTDSTQPTEWYTRTGSVLGTVPYMSPEQLRGEAAGPASDLFSCGILLFEMATGRRPFAKGSPAEVASSILREKAPPLTSLRPELPRELSRIVDRCLEKEIVSRCPSAATLVEELQALRPGTVPSAHGPSPAREAPSGPIRAIAVLPLANLSGDPGEEYFADGMTEAMITDLARAGGVKVISRTSVMGYKGTAKPMSEIARELGVDAVVEGAVLRAGSRVRISAQLIRGATDEHLWADRFDRQLEDVLDLQDEVARAIARQVDATLKSPDSGARAPRRKVDPEVYLLDLKGRQLWNRRTEDSFRSGLDCFQQAIDRDPTYAPAYVGLADCLNMLANYGFLPPRQIAPRARAAAERALELDEASAEAHRVLAFICWQFEFAWEAAIREYERALELDANSAVTAYWFGTYLGVIGFFEPSHAWLRRARELDPLSLLVPSVQGWVHFFARRFEEALPRYREVLALDPGYHVAWWFLGEALVELGRFDEGIAALERAVELSGPTSRLLGYTGYAYGRAGREEEARKALAELANREEQGYVPPYFPALVHAGLGEEDPALDRLERGWAEGDTMIRDLRADPHWDRTRSHPRFQALERGMAYPDPETSRLRIARP